MIQRVQRGTVFGVKNTAGKIVSWHVKYRKEIPQSDGSLKRIQTSHRLCDRNEKYFSATCKAVQDKCDEFMREINPLPESNMSVPDFWEQKYLPFIREHKKPSTVSGYEQIWRQHLKDHFSDKTLQEYRTHQGSQFLLTLTKKQGLRTLNHIRSLASGIFTHAINLGLLEQNPWHDVKILGKIRPAKPTAWYTLEESEDIISALVDHVDCQLVMSLACFLGLRPGEISGLQWNDFDDHSVHIRRAVVRYVVGSPKTPESVASLPLLDQVRVPLELWRRKCGNPTQGWVFQNKSGNPADPKSIVSRIIRPTVEAAGLKWKGLYAGRRGAGTAMVELTNGNYAAAQELLRHKHMSTTLQFYKKQTQQALSDGVKALEAALKPKALQSSSEMDG